MFLLHGHLSLLAIHSYKTAQHVNLTDQHIILQDKNKMMTYSKVEKNAKSIVKIKSVHSGFLPSVARKECAANHGRSRDFCNITLQVKIETQF